MAKLDSYPNNAELEDGVKTSFARFSDKDISGEFEYTGFAKADNIPHGKGTKVYTTNGDVQEGQWLNGIQVGNYRHITMFGAVLEGFKNDAGATDGTEVITYLNGSTKRY